MDQARTGMNSPRGSPITMSPLNRHLRSSSNMSKKTQNLQAMAAAQRLAKVMAHNSGDVEDDEDDDVTIDCHVTGLGLSAGRARRPRPSVPVLQPIEHSPSSIIRQSVSTKPTEPPIVQSTISVMSVSQRVKSTEAVSTSSAEQHPPAHMSRSRPFVGIKTVNKFISSTPLSLKQQTFKERNSLAPESRDASTLQDEVDMLQVENDNLVEKLQLLEERCEEAEARAKQFETQVSTLGEGISLEARRLSRKGTAFQRETVKVDSASALEQLQECESELRSLQSAVQRLVLTQEEMEEVVLKRCWLARYWGLCVQYGIHPDIAGDKYEYWSSWAPLPLEVVLSAGQKAKEDHRGADCDLEERDKVIRDVNQISGENNVESMLLVEKGLRELASLKVEDAVLLEMAQKRKQNLQRSAFSDETKSPIELHKFRDPCELSQDEAEDVQFKLAWLTYFWRRAKNHGLEAEIADERLQTWINQTSQTPNSHDAVDVERGMMELKKLGIDTILWEESRKCMDSDSQRSE